MPPSRESPTPKWYSTIYDLPLKIFIEVATTNNFDALTIAGKPTELQLRTAWTKITEEYADVLGDEERQLYAHLLKQGTRLELTINQIEMLVQMLEVF